MDLIYTRGERQKCLFCSRETRGVVTNPVSGILSRRVPVCPVCRDTKSKQVAIARLFGAEYINKIVSEESGAVSKVSIRDQLRPQKGVHIEDVDVGRIINGTWIAEPKYDGSRLVAYFLKDGMAFLSPRASKRTGEYVDHADCLPHIAGQYPELAGTVIDGEIISPVDKAEWDGMKMVGTLPITVAMLNADAPKSIMMQERIGRLQYHVFDVLKYKGEDVRNQPLSVRRDLLSKVLAVYRPEGVHAVPTWSFTHMSALKHIFESALKQGYEGLMLKDLTAPYYAPSVGARNKGWVKWKKTVTYDGFVTGFVPGERGNEGLVGALLISGYRDGKLREFAAVANLPEAYRREISKPDGTLRDDIYMKVVEVVGQELTKNGRIRHANIVRWRPDKTPEECEAPPFEADSL